MARYDVVDGGQTGNTLDMELSSTYSQDSGRSTDFILLTALRRTVSESFALNDADVYSPSISLTEQNNLSDVYGDTAVYLRSFSGSAGINDSAVKQILPVLNEDLSVSDDLTKNTGVVLPEQSSISDSLRFTSSKVFDASFAMNDSDVREAQKFLSQGVSVSDNRANKVSRSVPESFSLNEFFTEKVAVFIKLNELIGLNDVLQSKNVLKNVSEPVGLTDSTSKSLDRRVTEEVSVQDSFNSKGFFFRDYREELGVNELETSLFSKSLSEEASVTDNAVGFRFFKQLNQSLSVDDFEEFSLRKSFQEEAGVNDARRVGVFRTVSENFSLDDEIVKTFSKNLDAAFSINDSIRHINTFLVRNELVSVNDSDVRDVGKKLSEMVVTDGVYSREASFFRDYSDEVAASDEVRFKLERVIEEVGGVTLDANLSSTVGKSLDAGIEMDSVYSYEADFVRSFEEDTGLNDERSIKIVTGLSEDLAFSINLGEAKFVGLALTEDIGLRDGFKFFFSEGPGTSPYFVRNSFVEKNSMQNSYVTKSIQNMFEALDISNSFGDRDQA